MCQSMDRGYAKFRAESMVSCNARNRQKEAKRSKNIQLIGYLWNVL